MHRVARQDLEALVFVALATAPPTVRRKLTSKLPHEADAARDALAKSICDRIDNNSYMVIVAEIIGQAPYQKLGVWGVDEPLPATVPEPPKPPVAPKAIKYIS